MITSIPEFPAPLTVTWKDKIDYSVMKLLLIRFTCLILAAGFASGAGWPLDFFTSDPKMVVEAARKISTPEGVDLFVLDSQTMDRIDQGRLYRSTRILFRIETEAGAKAMSRYSQPWLA
jgi:hypothetical protein